MFIDSKGKRFQELVFRIEYHYCLIKNDHGLGGLSIHL